MKRFNLVYGNTHLGANTPNTLEIIDLFERQLKFLKEIQVPINDGLVEEDFSTVEKGYVTYYTDDVDIAEDFGFDGFYDEGAWIAYKEKRDACGCPSCGCEFGDVSDVDWDNLQPGQKVGNMTFIKYVDEDGEL